MPESQDRSLFAEHPREFEKNLYVYPVLSRRAGGISIGVNLNPDAACNFDCVYCQVCRGSDSFRSAAIHRRFSERDRESLSAANESKESGHESPHSKESRVDLDRLGVELDWMVDWVASGRIWSGTRFAAAPLQLRRLNDIAFSGDGEPTACPEFDRAVAVAAEIRSRRKLDHLKLILITNSTLLDRPRVRRGLEILDNNGGEIWAKLDAGTESYYRQINRSKIPFPRILDNLRETAKIRPIVIQSLFMQIDGQPPSDAELQAYCHRLREIISAGGQVKLVQIHTVARAPAERYVTALSNDQVDSIAQLVWRETNLPVTASYA